MKSDPVSLTKPEFACPVCKGILVRLACASCGDEYESVAGIPYFLAPKRSAARPEVGLVYDEIYASHENVWEDQGREAGFRKYFAELVQVCAPGPLLEIGCGEGLLMSAMLSEEKVGIDPSIHALTRAQRRASAQLAAAQAEYLPFSNGQFGAVTAVGVMEHFGDPQCAIREIHRVLAHGGAYVALIHLDMSRVERLQQKVREYLFPRLRVGALLRWLGKKLYKPIKQPSRRSYTVDSATDCLVRNGFQLERVISIESDPSAPLAGKHVVILVGRKGS
jgi:ubiquinone/menaquinone biosynthesis C-methylase UbiE